MTDFLSYMDFPIKREHLVDADLYKLMGYKGQKPEASILELVERMWSKLVDCCTPHAGYRLLDGGRYETDKVKVADAVLHTGPIIAEAMGEASSIAIFTVTLGAGYDKWMQEIKQEDNIMHEFVANSMATVVAESITEELIAVLRKNVQEQGLKATNNYSPGYCGWPLMEQQLLFSFLPNGISGITLTESCLMLPIKSVSGIIGVGENALKRPYGCAVCNMQKRCHHRKL